VARQTRSQRRARREAQQASGQAALAGGPPSAPSNRPTARGDAQPRRQPAERPERHVPAARTRNFVAESWAELKKVEWPGQNQVIQGTIVVLVACAVVGTYLYLNDQIWKQVVSKVFLGQ